MEKVVKTQANARGKVFGERRVGVVLVCGLTLPVGSAMDLDDVCLVCVSLR
jgi:hypothetical protein